MQKQFLVFSGFSGALTVIFGAMGAHALKAKLAEGLMTEAGFHAFEKGVTYQMYHTLALLMVALFADKLNNNLLLKAGYCFMIGIVLFSGSLYLLSTSALIGIANLNWLGPVTPVGGLFFIAGWVLLGLAGIKKN